MKKMFFVWVLLGLSFCACGAEDNKQAPSPWMVRAGFLLFSRDLLALSSEESGLTARTRLAVKGASDDVLKKNKEVGLQRRKEIIARRAEADRKIEDLEKKIVGLKALRARLGAEESKLPAPFDPAEASAIEFYRAIRKRGDIEENFPMDLYRAGRQGY